MKCLHCDGNYVVSENIVEKRGRKTVVTIYRCLRCGKVWKVEHCEDDANVFYN